MNDPGAPFYGQQIRDNAAEVIARGEPGYSRLELARSLAAWAVYDHFRGAFSWQRLEELPAMAELGRHIFTDRAEMSAQINETARLFGADLAGICGGQRG